ncbi:MAG: DUF362 domain-containing protein [Acidobacteriota bacterium]
MTHPAHALRVAVSGTGSAAYPRQPPFDPSEQYPELPGAVRRSDSSNTVYAGVREALHLLGLDAPSFGTRDWNPLGTAVHPGDRVVVKPNMVRHFHGSGGSLDALVTHGSVVRAVLDYVVIALRGEGRITVGDSPLQYADFAATLSASGLERVVEEVRRYATVPIDLVDFRKERSEKRSGLIVSRVPNDGDPRGYRPVELNERSRFADVSVERSRKFRVTQFDPAAMARAHNSSRHAYLFPATILEADVLVNLPKLKTHRKAGITAAMKNLVGINGSKDWLPHHTAGARTDGGDEYLARCWRKATVGYLRDRIETTRSRAARRMIHGVEWLLKATGKVTPFPDDYWEGSWHGNDTLWRMVHDLHQVLYFADASGSLHDEPVRRYFAVVDAVIAGEGDGPMRPTPKAAALIVAGANPAAIDIVCSRLMGFDPHKIPLLANTLGNERPPSVPGLDAIQVVSSETRWQRPFDLARAESLKFRPPVGWEGAIELNACEGLLGEKHEKGARPGSRRGGSGAR